MNLNIIQDGDIEYVKVGDGPNLVLLHGLFGALSNWHSVIDEFKKRFTVFIPLMPIYKETSIPPSVEGLTDYVVNFVQKFQLNDIHLVGNSLGGHIGLTFTLRHPEYVQSLVLTGSSGLFEEGMGSSFPRRGDYKFIKERVEFTFYDPKTATTELVDEVYQIVNDNYKALRVVKIARAAQRMNMSKEITKIKVPTCLIWGLNDMITPTYVAHEFRRLIPNSELQFIDRCGHAAMMEQPILFNQILSNFLMKHIFTQKTTI